MSAPASQRDPEAVGPYRLVQRIGEGGMGVVHLGLDTDGRAVAVKVLRQHVAADPDARRRLSREVATLRRVQHPQVAEVIDADVAGELPYLVTRFVPGRTLDLHVRDHGPLTRNHLRVVGELLADALRDIHAAGVVHRDVKPANVMLLDGEPVLIDFGIAHVADEARITLTGLVMGTPGYLSPEVLSGEDVTPATDWWGWGATLAFAATGRSPFGTGPLEVVLDRVRRGKLDLTGMDPALTAALTAALAVDPAERAAPDVLLRDMAGPPARHGAPSRDAPTAVVPAVDGATAVVPSPAAAVTAHVAGPSAAATTRVPPPGDAAGAAPFVGVPGPDALRPGADRPPARSNGALHGPDAETAVAGIAPTRRMDGPVRPAAVQPYLPPAPPATYPPPAYPVQPYQPDPYRPQPGALAPYPPAGPGGHPDRGAPPPAVTGPPASGPAAPTDPSRFARGVPAGVALALCAGAVVAPYGVFWLAVYGMITARVVERSSTALVLRRSERGPRGTDGVVTALAVPWRVVLATLATLLAMIIPALVGVSTAFIVANAEAAAGGDTELASPAALFLGMAALLATAWWGPGGGSLRRGTRATTRTLTRGPRSRIATWSVLGLFVLAALIQYSSGAAPDFGSWDSSLFQQYVRDQDPRG